MESAKFYCGRCLMNFAISRPRFYNVEGGCEITHCAEPGCGQRFWHTVDPHRIPPVKVGISPEDAPSANFALRGGTP